MAKKSRWLICVALAGVLFGGYQLSKTDVGQEALRYFQNRPAVVQTVSDEEIKQRRIEIEQQIPSSLEGKIYSARKEDYVKWLEDYIIDGNSPTHYYDYPMSGVIDGFFVARDNFEIAPLYGSSSISIIVPEGVEFLGGGLGHSNLYFMEGHENKGGFVPVYSDLTFSDLEVAKVVNEFRDQELAKDQEFEREMEQRRIETEHQEAKARSLLQGKLEPASVDDYIRWLEDYIIDGNSPTHYYDYPMSRVIDGFFVARDNFEIAPLYGSSSISIIVPEGVESLGGGLGHSNLYFMEDHENKGGFVPVYSDLTFSDLEVAEVVNEFRDQELAKDQEFEREWNL